MIQDLLQQNPQEARMTREARPTSRPPLWRRVIDFGRQIYSRLRHRKSAKNPNIYPLY